MHKAGVCKAHWVRSSVAVIAGLTLCCAEALAQENESLRPVTENGITYVSGGVGEDESTAIRAMESKFNLHLLFAEKSGTYLSGVDVVIMSATGTTIIALKSDGPMLLMRLAPGRYLVSATAEQGKQTRWVTVPSRGTVDANFYWG